MLRAERKMAPKTKPRVNPRRDEELEVGPELELELVELPVDVGDPVCPTDPDEDGMVTFVRYM